jgi:hypothetical protein
MMTLGGTLVIFALSYVGNALCMIDPRLYFLMNGSISFIASIAACLIKVDDIK